MLKIRVMPTLLHSDTTLVKGVAFDSRRRVGSAMQAVRVYEMRGVDELVFLDVTATRQGRGPDLDLVDDLADQCFMPLTVGGGVRTVEDVNRLLSVGADKVAVNTRCVDAPGDVEAMARRFGSQCVVASIDVARDDAGTPRVVTHSGTVRTPLDPVAHAVAVEALGAGEILLTSVDRDGTMGGYDLELLAAVTSSVAVPVIASGGAGGPADMVAAVEAGASAVAAASIYHFTEQTPRECKAALAAAGHPVRI